MSNRILQFMDTFTNSLKSAPLNEITTIQQLASSVGKGQGTLEGYHIPDNDTITAEYGLDDPVDNNPRNPLEQGVSTEQERLQDLRSAPLGGFNTFSFHPVVDEFNQNQLNVSSSSGFAQSGQIYASPESSSPPLSPPKYQGIFANPLNTMTNNAMTNNLMVNPFEQFKPLLTETIPIKQPHLPQDSIYPSVQEQQANPSAPLVDSFRSNRFPVVQIEKDYYNFQGPLQTPSRLEKLNQDLAQTTSRIVTEDLSTSNEIANLGDSLDIETGMTLKNGKLTHRVGFLEDTLCPMTDNEKLVFINTFQGWTGIEYDDFTEEEMLDEMNNVRAFLKHDLSLILGLSGVMADINGTMFMKELNVFNEPELMGYASLFHLDLQPLDDLQIRLNEQYSSLYSKKGVTEEELEEMQKLNLDIYLNMLKSIIIDFKLWMIYRLRLWRWREEVLLGNVGETLEVYPGLTMIHEFESSAEIMSNGIYDYFIRVGEAKRETLMDRFRFFDLYHILGKLSLAYDRELDFGTDAQYEDVADAILYILDEKQVDPRHLLTPLGIRVIYNSEEGEVIYNLYRYQTHDEELLRLACSQAGIDVMRDTVIELEDGTLQSKRDNKPEIVILEELTSQYLSPQFYTGIESHRNYKSAISSLKTLSGDRLTNAEEGDIIFYGVGDGVSTYRIYRPRELAEVFLAYKGFIDPYSVRDNPKDPHKWSRFSLQSIKRLLSLVIPRLRTKCKNNGTIHTQTLNESDIASLKAQRRKDLDELQVGSVLSGADYVNTKILLESDIAILRAQQRQDLDDLEAAIMENMDTVDIDDPNTIDQYIKPRGQQQIILDDLKNNLEYIRIPLASFLTYLFNMGVQLSDWTDDIIRIDQNAIDAALEEDPQWKYFDPETTANLTENIFNMLTVESIPYINVIGSDGKDYSRHIKSLKLVKHYLGAYRIDWNDELSSIDGHFYRMIQANNLSYYNYLSISGNWLMATANYYAIEILQQPLNNITLEFVGDTPDIDDYDDY